MQVELLMACPQWAGAEDPAREYDYGTGVQAPPDNSERPDGI